MDNEVVFNKLMEEIESVEEAISQMNVDTEEYGKAVTHLEKLWKMALDVEKLNNESHEKSEVRLSNEMIEREKLEESKKDRKWRVGVSLAGVLLSGVLYAANALIGYSIEENGCIASPTLKKATASIDKFFDKKSSK